MQLTPEQVLKYLNREENNPKSSLVKKWEDVYYEISLHTKGARPKFEDPSSENSGWIVPPGYMGEKYQYLFDKFLLARYPRESDITRQWRFSQYRPFTKGPFDMLTDVLVGAIFQDSQYTLILPEKEDYDFIWDNNFQQRNLIQYFADIILANMIEDPNGILVRIPSKPFKEQNGDKVDVDVWFINSKDIIFYDDEDIIFKRDGFAYWVNDLVIFRYYLNDNKVFQVEPEGYFAHMLGYLPVTVAGGKWNTNGYYDSFYQKAVPAANEFISSFSAEQMTDKEASHPFIVQVAEDCPECDGVGKITMPCDDCPGGLKAVTCPKCHGKKTISVNPGDRFLVPPEMADKNVDMIKIVSPDVQVNEYHRKKNDEIMDMILRSLNLLNIDAAQSGKAKAIDQEKLYTFISKISNHIFDDLIFPTVRDIIAYRNVRVEDGEPKPYVYEFTLIKPSQFQVKTAMDLLNEFSEGSKANLPGFLRKKMVLDFVDKRFGGDEVFQKKAGIISDLDDVNVYSVDERLTMRTSGEISLEDCIFSIKLPVILDEIIRDKSEEWFLKSNFDPIKAEIDKRMKPFLEQPDGFQFRDNNGSQNEGS